ncbi:MAG: histidine phosphatase family protein [bacterium]|nr:histidine phosphatase family protein [bacterium]
MNLYVVRHGETIWNKYNKVQGITDIPLSEKGIEEAKSLKKIVESLYIDVVISSPLKRALDTAKILTGSININTDDRIKERSWGLNEGANISDVDSVDCWDVILNTKVQNIECIQDFMYRVSSFIEDIKVRYKDRNVLVVTHSAVSRVIHYLLEGIPEDGDLSKIDIPNLRIIEYKIN